MMYFAYKDVEMNKMESNDQHCYFVEKIFNIFNFMVIIDIFDKKVRKIINQNLRTFLLQFLQERGSDTGSRLLRYAEVHWTCQLWLATVNRPEAFNTLNSSILGRRLGFQQQQLISSEKNDLFWRYSRFDLSGDYYLFGFNRQVFGF